MNDWAGIQKVSFLKYRIFAMNSPQSRCKALECNTPWDPPQNHRGGWRGWSRKKPTGAGSRLLFPAHCWCRTRWGSLLATGRAQGSGLGDLRGGSGEAWLRVRVPAMKTPASDDPPPTPSTPTFPHRWPLGQVVVYVQPPTYPPCGQPPRSTTREGKHGVSQDGSSAAHLSSLWHREKGPPHH